MSRINTNIQSLIAQRALTRNNYALSNSLVRLSTGSRINSGKDDPAGLIASQALKSETTALSAAITNAERADQITNIAEGGLSQVSDLLTQLQSLITATASSAGLSTDEKNANQLQIDSILQTIDRVAGATAFQGKKLLNGNLDYVVSTPNAGVADFRVNAAKLSNGNAVSVEASVIASAQKAGLFLSFAGNLNLGGDGGTFTIEIAGAKGSRQLAFSSGTHVSAITAAINTFTQITGVAATTSGTTGLKLTSSEYGSDAFVSVKTIDDAGITGTGIGVFDLDADDFSVTTGGATAYSAITNGKRDLGQDINVTINGLVANAKGRTARIATDFLDVELTFNDASGNNKAQTTGTFTAFSVQSGGADFQLASRVDIAGKASIGIGNITASNLGNSVVGYLSSLGTGKANAVATATDLSDAQDVVAAAINQVSSLRGRLGAFQKNVIGATIQSLNISLENTSAAQSAIADADFATETANLTRNQILVQAATNALLLANQTPQNVLNLLR